MLRLGRLRWAAVHVGETGRPISGRVTPPHVRVRRLIGWRIVDRRCWSPQRFFLQASCTPRSVPCKHLAPQCAMNSRDLLVFWVLYDHSRDILASSRSSFLLSSIRCQPDPRCPPSPCRLGISTTRTLLPAVPTYSDLQRPQRHSIRSHHTGIFLKRLINIRKDKLIIGNRLRS